MAAPASSVTWNDKSSETVVQALHDAIWTDTDANSTTYSNRAHMICVSQSQSITVGTSGTFSLSGSIPEGGICVLAQKIASGIMIDLGTIRELTDALLEHGCSTCGGVPIDYVTKGSNDPSDGILTFDYESNPYCIESCMSASQTPTWQIKTRIRGRMAAR